MFDVPASFRHASRMDADGKDRARKYALDAMTRSGLTPAALALRAGIDEGTVREFVYGPRWPRVGKRNAMEEALGLETGVLERVARGLEDQPAAGESDPVIAAVEVSELGGTWRATDLISRYQRHLSEHRADRVG